MRYTRSPLSYALKIRADHGDAVRFRSLAGRGIAVCSADLAREVFAAPPESFEVPSFAANLFGPRAVIVTSGSVHRKQRRLLNPRFHGSRIKSLMTAMQRVIRTHCDRLESAAKSGAIVTLSDVTQAMTLDVILETVFGESENLDRGRARTVLGALIDSFDPVLIGLPMLQTPLFPPWRRVTNARRDFDTWLDGLTAARRRSDTLGGDVLGMLLDARYDDDSAMDQAEIRDNVLTLLLAGHETSAIALAWSVYHLLRNPSTHTRLRAELDALGREPSVEAITRLPYLQAVVSETLRVEPIVTDVTRVCRAPFVLGSRWTVPAGENIAVLLVAILHDPRLFPEPSRFRPERFLDGRFGPGEFVPFGGGARRCLGAAFAESELAIALATLVGEWNLALASDRPERGVRRNITVGPEHGVRIRVLGRREASATAASRADAE